MISAAPMTLLSTVPIGAIFSTSRDRGGPLGRAYWFAKPAGRMSLGCAAKFVLGRRGIDSP